MAPDITLSALRQQILADPEHALRLYKRNGLSVQTLRELAAKYNDTQVQIFLAGYQETPSRVLEKLSEASEHPEVLRKLALNLRTPKTVQQHLARHENISVRQAVASSRGISPQTALILSDDLCPEVRATLAANNVITPRIQTRLSEDSVPFVRANLLSSSRLDEEVLLALADDRDFSVRARAILASKMPDEDLLQLADSDELISQRLLLARRQLPPAVLESLLFSPHGEIQCAAVARQVLTADEMLGFAKTGSEQVKSQLASLKNLLPAAQVELAGTAASDTRRILAGNAFLCEEAAMILADSAHDDLDLLLALAGNSSLTTPVVFYLATLGNPLLAKRLSQRPSLPSKVVSRLLEEGGDDIAYHLAWHGHGSENLPAPLLCHLAEHYLPTLRQMAARSQPLPDEIADKLRHDPVTATRLELADNSSVAPEILAFLTNDENCEVADTAKATLQQLQQHNSPTNEKSNASSPGKSSLLRRLIGKVINNT